MEYASISGLIFNFLINYMWKHRVFAVFWSQTSHFLIVCPLHSWNIWSYEVFLFLWKVQYWTFLFSLALSPESHYEYPSYWEMQHQQPHCRTVQTGACWAMENIELNQTNTSVRASSFLFERNNHCVWDLVHFITVMHHHISRGVCWQSLSVMSFAEHDCITCLLISYARQKHKLTLHFLKTSG